MQQAIQLLSKKEKELAEKYFRIIDKNQDGFLTKLELQVIASVLFCRLQSVSFPLMPD
jgi:hypothetical protein